MIHIELEVRVLVIHRLSRQRAVDLLATRHEFDHVRLVLVLSVHLELLYLLAERLNGLHEFHHLRVLPVVKREPS